MPDNLEGSGLPTQKVGKPVTRTGLFLMPGLLRRCAPRNDKHSVCTLHRANKTSRCHREEARPAHSGFRRSVEGTATCPGVAEGEDGSDA